MPTPFYVTVPKALRDFKLRSIHRTVLSTLAIALGFKKSLSKKNVVITFSISEDYARVWHYFAKKNLPSDTWDILIVDCAGDMRKDYFPGAELVKFANISHGAKIDIFLNSYLRSDVVFICDDDKYILSDLSPIVHEFTDRRVAAISLAPRDWYKIKINRQEYLPMGSYAVMIQRNLIVQNKLSFRSKKRHFKSRIVESGAKEPYGYDTADYANEKLLELDYTVITKKDQIYVAGFDGLSAPRVFLMRYGKKFALESLAAAGHYKKGSTNGVIARVLYGVVKFEELFHAIFKANPSFVSGLSTQELRTSVSDSAILASYNELDALTRKLFSTVSPK